MHYDRNGEPIPLLQWAKLFEDPDYHVLKQDYFGPYFVSTVWLGIDHAFGVGPPVIFETMVFRDGDDLDQWRYCTEEEALAGHEQMCEQVRVMLPLEAG